MFNKKETKTGRQQAEIFRLKFQDSNICKKFRIYWNVPLDGFKNRNEYYKWDEKHVQEVNEYRKSEKYKENREKIKEKKLEQAQGKISRFDLEFFAHRLGLYDPSAKLEFDISHITLKSGKPIYWRDFIEQCLFFANPDICFPDKPLPEPKLKWSNTYQYYELIIKDIYPDTDIKDFTNRKFLKEFEKLKEKLPGFNNLEPRYRKDLDFCLKLREIDKTMPYLDDFQKYEHVTEEDLSQTTNLKQEKKIKNKVKQARLRTKKLLEEAW